MKQAVEDFYGRILKANLSWSILSQIYVTKLELEYLEFGFKCKET